MCLLSYFYAFVIVIRVGDGIFGNGKVDHLNIDIRYLFHVCLQLNFPSEEVLSPILIVFCDKP